jgi:phosphatidylserine/phosphatidylglycerophosphate/cardiolipin synthase-like enzyme
VLVQGKVTSAAAKALLAYRDGADATIRTADDNLFDTVREVDDVKGVGSATLKRLVTLADTRGYLAAEKAKQREVIFSPQLAAESHNAEVARVIASAKSSLDIAMYSYSDAGIAAALADAVKRGVKVRFIFETASEDRKATTSAALAATKSGKLEAMGVDVRWVNKIMHHKLMIVDGPRDAAEAASTATLVTGSGNWSNGAATVYDENTLFMTGYPELGAAHATRVQPPLGSLDRPGVEHRDRVRGFDAGDHRGVDAAVARDARVLDERQLHRRRHVVQGSRPRTR